MSECNGWTNFETWTLATILSNTDEMIYNQVKRYDRFRLEDYVNSWYRDEPELFQTIEDWSLVNWRELSEDL